MHRSARLRGAAAASAALILPASLALAAAGSASAGTVTAATSRYAYTRNVLPGLSSATDLGAASATTPMSVIVGVARPRAAAEDAYLAAEHNPSSSLYGKFLTPATFASQFGVSSGVRSAVTSWLNGSGLHVTQVSAAGDVVQASGPASAVQSTFGTTIHTFTYAGRQFLANTSSPHVPAGLPVTTIVGLNTLQGFSLPASGTSQDTCVNGICTGATTPKDLWSVYQQPTAYQGKGQQLAVFGEGRSDDVISDLRVFEQHNSLPAMPVVVKHPAADTNFTDDSGLEEWNIDTQASSGMAPKASKLTLYFGSDLSDADVLRLFSQWTDDTTGPKQANASFGECEQNPTNVATGGPLSTLPLPAGEGLGNNLQPLAEAVLREAAMSGKTLFSSTGDTGSSCPVVYAAVIGAGNGVVNQGAPLTNYPASSPYAVGVGGTVLYTDGAGHRTQPEYAWTYTGGGSTYLIARPAYQQGVTANSIPCVADSSGGLGLAGQPCRGIPDVAAQSGDVLTNGYAIVSAGQPTIGGGTSLSSPLWEGMWARVQGAKGGQGNGFANFPLYRAGLNPASAARDYYDVTTGSNGLYAATTGWDYVSGWGTPKVSGLICDITKHC